MPNTPLRACTLCGYQTFSNTFNISASESSKYTIHICTNSQRLDLLLVRKYSHPGHEAYAARSCLAQMERLCGQWLKKKMRQINIALARLNAATFARRAQICLTSLFWISTARKKKKISVHSFGARTC